MQRTASATAKMFGVSKQTVLYWWHKKYGKQKIKKMYAKPINFNISPQDLIRIGGAIDARGIIGITGVDGETNQRPYIAIGSKSLKFIKDIASKLGVSYQTRKKANGNYYHINVRKLGVDKLIEALLPYFVIKQEKAKLVLKYVKLRKEDYTGTEYSDIEVKICECLHYFNARTKQARKKWKNKIKKKYNMTPNALKKALLY